MLASTRRTLLAALGVLAMEVGSSWLALVPIAAQTDQPRDRTIRVPQDQPTIDAAVDASKPGTVILLDRGTYPGGVVVPAAKPGITIRGTDRNEVVFDGEDERANAIVVEADDVVLENMTAHNFVGNGFYWTGVEGYAGRYLTVWNVGLYGIYAIESRGGVFEHSYVSGAADAAFYIGECNPCDAVVTEVTARLSAVGYSGTNAGGNLEIRDSLWELNGTAIMPNSFEGQPLPPPQRSSVISGNTIRDSGAQPVPANSPLAGYYGMGVSIAGGWENLVEDNDISGSASYGIALFAPLQPSGIAIRPQLNIVRGNTITDSATADLAVADGSADTNCFADNSFATSLPADIETLLPCRGKAATTGDAAVLADLGAPIPELLERLGARPSYTEMTAPDPQPTMPDVAPPSPRSQSPLGTASSAASDSGLRGTSSAPSPSDGSVEPGPAAPDPAAGAGVIRVVLAAAGALVVLLLGASYLSRRRRRG